MKPLLEIRDVSLSYHTSAGETPALSHLTFDLMPGEFLAVVGPSGWKIHSFESDLRTFKCRRRHYTDE